MQKLLVSGKIIIPKGQVRGMDEKPAKELKTTPYNEDVFDLDTYKKTMRMQTQIRTHNQQTRRRIGIYRIFIMILAFVIAYWLYNLASGFIMQHEYNKYHTSAGE